MAELTRTSTIPAETAASADDLWALSVLVKAQWQSGVKVNPSYHTTVEHAKSASEQRRGRLTRPSHVLSVDLQATTQEESLKLKMLLMRATVARSLVPLYCDETVMSAAVAAGANVVPGTTSDRRFFAGGRVALLSPDGETFEVAVIASAASGSVTLTAPLANDFPLDSWVYPLMEADVRLVGRGSIQTDHYCAVKLEAVETIGPTQIKGLVEVETLPEGFDTFRGLPVLTGPVEYARPIAFGFDRYGLESTSNVASVLDAYGSRGRAAYSLPFTCTTREIAGRLMRFFASRGGRLYPFWVASPSADYIPLSLIADDNSVDGVTVRAIGPERDWDYRPFVAITLNDGTVYVREISEHSRVGDVDTLTFDSAIVATFTLSDVVRVGMGHMCKFASDEMEENWVTTEKMLTALDVIEVLEEKSKAVTYLAEITTSALTSEYVDPDCPHDATPEVPVVPPVLTVHYQLCFCNGLELNDCPADLYFGVDLDPASPVIRVDIDGTIWGCYIRVEEEPTEEPATDPVPDVVSGYATCVDCVGVGVPYAIRYDLCDDQPGGTPTSLFIHPDADPGSAIARSGGFCYRRIGPVTGVIPEHTATATGHTTCDDCVTTVYYRQARACPSPGSLVDLWMTEDDAGSSFKYNGTCYYFGDDEPSETPGTVITPDDVEEFVDCDACEEDEPLPVPTCASCGSICISDDSLVDATWANSHTAASPFTPVACAGNAKNGSMANIPFLSSSVGQVVWQKDDLTTTLDIGGNIYHLRVKVTYLCPSDTWRLDTMWYYPTGNVSVGVAGGTFDNPGNALGVTGVMTDNALTSACSDPMSSDEATWNGSISLKNNRCCKCESGDCVPTSNGSANSETDNGCTAGQSDNCP